MNVKKNFKPFYGIKNVNNNTICCQKSFNKNKVGSMLSLRKITSLASKTDKINTKINSFEFGANSKKQIMTKLPIKYNTSQSISTITPSSETEKEIKGKSIVNIVKKSKFNSKTIKVVKNKKRVPNKNQTISSTPKTKYLKISLNSSNSNTNIKNLNILSTPKKSQCTTSNNFNSFSQIHLNNKLSIYKDQKLRFSHKLFSQCDDLINCNEIPKEKRKEMLISRDSIIDNERKTKSSKKKYKNFSFLNSINNKSTIYTRKNLNQTEIKEKPYYLIFKSFNKTQNCIPKKNNHARNKNMVLNFNNVSDIIIINKNTNNHFLTDIGK